MDAGNVQEEESLGLDGLTKCRGKMEIIHTTDAH